jgi:hypothetical protein
VSRKRGPLQLSKEKIAHSRFDLEDAIRGVEYMMESDPATAALVLHKTIATLIEFQFDLKQKWIPAPKQRLQVIRNIDARLAELLEAFYTAMDLAKQIRIAKEAIQYVFGKK